MYILNHLYDNYQTNLVSLKYLKTKFTRKLVHVLPNFWNFLQIDDMSKSHNFVTCIQLYKDVFGN